MTTLQGSVSSQSEFPPLKGGGTWERTSMSSKERTGTHWNLGTHWQNGRPQTSKQLAPEAVASVAPPGLPASQRLIARPIDSASATSLRRNCQSSQGLSSQGGSR
jgi:hypothetical protein